MMAQRSRSLWQTVWGLKWWWLPPVTIMIIVFVVLVLYSNITGDAPFEYVIF